ncbi:MAG: hypothetical protein C0490_09335, partial [Marivirga sp.]|nr:hypothetical protein [Marivirga sp.]
STALHQEKASGIFITMDYPRKTPCENELKMIIGKAKVCISKKPIILIKELKYVSDIQYDPKNKVYYIDAGLTPSGMQTLNKTITSLPQSKFALVVENEVICLFKVTTETSVHAIRMGEDAALEDLKTIQTALKKIDL